MAWFELKRSCFTAVAKVETLRLKQYRYAVVHFTECLARVVAPKLPGFLLCKLSLCFPVLKLLPQFGYFLSEASSYTLVVKIEILRDHIIVFFPFLLHFSFSARIFK